MQPKLRVDYFKMQHREYNTVNNLSVSSFEFDPSEDELSEEEYYKHFRNFRPASGSRIFQRFLLNIIDIPNNLTNRLRDWLRSTNGGSTSDKSSGTNSTTSRIRLSEYSANDCDFYHKNVKNSVKNNRRYVDARAERNCQEAFDDHRYSKNHHVYHVYKQNKMGIERVVREQHNYSSSWLQKNGRISSSPVLVLPRIDPETGLPIFQPRNQHARTATVQQSLKHKEKKVRGEVSKNARILQFQENHYTHLRGDSNLIDKLLQKQNTEKTSPTINKNSKQRFDHNQDNDHYKKAQLAKLNKMNPKDLTFPESISMQVEMKNSQSLFEAIQKKNMNIIKNEEKVKTDPHLQDFSDLQNLSTVAQNNVDALLTNLRQKINSFNAEKKTNRPVVHLSSVIDPNTGSQDRNHLLGARWQDKSGLFTRAIKPAYTEARASFTERIQDIWTQEKTSSQRAVFHNHKNFIYGPKNEIKRQEYIEEQKEIIISDTTTKEISKNDRILKMSATQSSLNYEMAKPIVCDVAVQYSNSKSLNVNESLQISSSNHILTLENNENKLGMQIPQIPEAINDPEDIITNSIQFPPQQKSQALVQHEISEVASGLIHPKPLVLPESKANTESLLLTDQNKRKMLSADTDSPMNINAGNSHFTFSPQKIKADVQKKIPEIITTERHKPSKERSSQNIPTFVSIASQNINSGNSQYAVRRQKKKLRSPLKRTTNSVALLEAKAITENFPSTEENEQKNCSANKNDSVNINTRNLLFPFPQKIEAEVQCKIPEIITMSENNPSKKQTPQNSQTLLKFQPELKILDSPFEVLQKNQLNPTSRFSHSSLRSSSKSRICRFPNKVGLWLSNKFHSTSGQTSPISPCSSRTLPSRKSSKLTCTMRSIFKCIEKTSELNVPQSSMNKGCQIPSVFQANEMPMSLIRRKKHEAQSSTVKNDIVASKDEENCPNVIIDSKGNKMITADFRPIEPAMSGNRRTPSKRSMTTLSVTTSNSTNIPLQLLGSTSDTNIVPSHDSQDDFNRQVDHSNATEIITRNRAIEMCEETDHYYSDSLLPEGNTEVNEKSEKIDYDDRENIETCDGINYCDSDPFLFEGSAEINEKVKITKSDNNKKMKNFETDEETDHYVSDLSLTEENKKNKKSIYDNKKIKKDSLKIKTDEKSVTNFCSVNAELKNVGQIRHVNLIRKPQGINSLAQKRRRENLPIDVNINGNRSFDIQNVSTDRSKYSNIETSVSDKNADRNVQNPRLNRRKSRIDIVVDKSPKEEHKGKRTEIRNVHNKRLERRESLLNIGADDFSNDAARPKSRDSQEPYNCREISSIESESKNPARKLRQRTDSPMIPCRTTDPEKRRSIAAGKSSLIPVGIGNSRCISTIRKTNEKVDNSCKKTKINENKNQISAKINPNLIARPSLKKTLRNSSEANEKKNLNYRVRFELNKKTSKEEDFTINNAKKRNASSEKIENLRIDDKRIIRKIKSSLENGEPLKRIKITEPGLISKRTAKSSAVKFEVEKDVIDQARETCSTNQNSSRRERMSLISGADNENVYQTYPHRESTLSEQIPKARGSFEKRHQNESKISYRPLLIEKRKNNYSVKKTNEALPQFTKSKKPETLKRQSIVDFSRIKEQVDNEILEQTSRSSGTEDCDCAIVLIKAINSSMELSDA